MYSNGHETRALRFVLCHENRQYSIYSFMCFFLCFRTRFIMSQCGLCSCLQLVMFLVVLPLFFNAFSCMNSMLGIFHKSLLCLKTSVQILVRVLLSDGGFAFWNEHAEFHVICHSHGILVWRLWWLKSTSSFLMWTSCVCDWVIPIWKSRSFRQSSCNAKKLCKTKIL